MHRDRDQHTGDPASRRALGRSRSVTGAGLRLLQVSDLRGCTTGHGTQSDHLPGPVGFWIALRPDDIAGLFRRPTAGRDWLAR
jgi:hypothetical protein